MKEVCETIKLIPQSELVRVFRDSETASADMDYTFLCFEDVYMKVKEHCDSNTIIIDFGCAYAPQSYWFTDCEKYIGVDLPMMNDVRFHTDNSEMYIMSGQKFIREVLPAMELDYDHVIAICSYVPDRELQKLVAESFRYNYVKYCTNVISNRLPPIKKGGSE